MMDETLFSLAVFVIKIWAVVAVFWVAYWVVRAIIEGWQSKEN